MTNVTTKAAPAVPFNYDAYDLVGATVKELESTAADILSLGRKSTAQIFDLGRLFEHAAGLVEEGAYGKWIKERCDIEPKTARNYRAIFRNLEVYRERIVWLGVSPTVLIHLSSAPEEKIEEALSFAERNGRIKVSDVKALLKDDASSRDQADADADPTDIGGLDGLKAMIALKIKGGLTSFLEHTSALQTTVGDALAARATGKRLVKSKLIDQVEATARLAHRELSSLVLFVQPLDRDPCTIQESRLPKASHWSAVLAMLYNLGGRDYWPEAKELQSWLASEVMPLLDWATARTRLPEWPLAASEDAPVAGPRSDVIMQNGLEALSGIVQVEAPSLDPAETELLSAGELADLDEDGEEDMLPIDVEIVGDADIAAKTPKSFRPPFLDVGRTTVEA